MPQLFTKDIALVQQFFESMCKVGERSHQKSDIKFSDNSAATMQ